MSHYLIPQLLKESTTGNNFILAYIKYNAKYGNTSVVKKAHEEAKKAKLITAKESVLIHFLSGYGCIRPVIRKLYYLFFRRIKIS